MSIRPDEITAVLEEELKDYKNSYIIIKIPAIYSAIYGRKVGYKFEKITLPNFKCNSFSCTPGVWAKSFWTRESAYPESSVR